MPVDVDYNERVTYYFFYEMIDSVSYLGGIFEATEISIYVVTPFIMLYFLYKIVEMIQESYTNDYRNQLWKSFKTYFMYLPNFSEKKLQQIEKKMEMMSNIEQITFLNDKLNQVFKMIKCDRTSDECYMSLKVEQDKQKLELLRSTASKSRLFNFEVLKIRVNFYPIFRYVDLH